MITAAALTITLYRGVRGDVDPLDPGRLRFIYCTADPSSAENDARSLPGGLVYEFHGTFRRFLCGTPRQLCDAVGVVADMVQIADPMRAAGIDAFHAICSSGLVAPKYIVLNAASLVVSRSWSPPCAVVSPHGDRKQRAMADRVGSMVRGSGEGVSLAMALRQLTQRTCAPCPKP